MLCVSKYRSNPICSIKVWPVNPADFVALWEQPMPAATAFVLSDELNMEGFHPPAIKHRMFTRFGRCLYTFQSGKLCRALRTKDLKRAVDVRILMHEAFGLASKQNDVFRWLNPGLFWPAATGGRFFEVYIHDFNSLHISFNGRSANLHHFVSVITKWFGGAAHGMDLESVGVLNSLFLHKACFCVFVHDGKLFARTFPEALLDCERGDAIRAHVGIRDRVCGDIAKVYVAPVPEGPKARASEAT